MILELLNYRYCDTQERQTLQTKARQAARIFGKPVYVFRELMHYLQQQRIVAPGYSFLQDTVGKHCSMSKTVSSRLRVRSSTPPTSKP